METEKSDETTGDDGNLPRSIEIDDLSDVQFQWHGNMLRVGAIWIGCVCFDLRHSPPINAYVGNNENIIGWFETHEDARAAIVRYIRNGPDPMRLGDVNGKAP